MRATCALAFFLILYLALSQPVIALDCNTETLGAFAAQLPVRERAGWRSPHAMRPSLAFDLGRALFQHQRAELTRGGVRPEDLSQLRDHGRRTKVAVVLIHGLSESPRGVEALANLYHQQGANVVSVCLPGHGSSPKDIHNLKLDAIRTRVDNAIKLAGLLGDNVAVAGFSFGGALAIDAGFRQPETVKWISAHSPAIAVSKPLALGLESRIDDFKKNPDDPAFQWTEGVTAAPDFVEFAYGRSSVNGFIVVNQLSVELADRWKANQPHPPIHIVQVRKDGMVSTNAIADFATALNLPPDAVTTLLREQGSGHFDTARPKGGQPTFPDDVMNKFITPMFIHFGAAPKPAIELEPIPLEPVPAAAH